MIVCNGRCLRDKLTGLQRYTSEIVKRLPDIEVVMPPKTWTGRSGYIWEQALLPFEAKGRLIWNPANTGQLIPSVNQVLTLHDLAMIEGPDSISSPKRATYYKMMLPYLLKSVRGVLTVSEYSRGQIIERFNYPPERILATHLGVDHRRFRPYGINDYGALLKRLDLEPGFILSVGSGSARKNLKGLIDAWRSVQHRVPDIKLVITGDATAYSSAFDGTEIPPLPDRTMLTGRISDEDLPLLMAAAGVFALPSFFEGFGLPIIESMACGTPVLASRVTSLPEVVGNAGVLIDPYSSDDIGEGLVMLLNDPSLTKNYAKAGIERAAEFDWDITAKKTHDFLMKFA